LVNKFTLGPTIHATLVWMKQTIDHTQKEKQVEWVQIIDSNLARKACQVKKLINKPSTLVRVGMIESHFPK